MQHKWLQLQNLVRGEQGSGPESPASKHLLPFGMNGRGGEQNVILLPVSYLTSRQSSSAHRSGVFRALLCHCMDSSKSFLEQQSQSYIWAKKLNYAMWLGADLSRTLR